MPTIALKVHLALFSVALIYAANYSIAKYLMPAFMGPMAVIFYRIGGALVLYFLMNFFIKSNQKIQKKDWKLIAISALFGIAANQLAFFKGLSLTSPLHASLLMLVTPILVLLIKAYLNKKMPSALSSVGILTGICGATWLVLGNANTDGVSDLLGDFFVFINAVFFGIYLVIAKPLLQKYGAVKMSKWLFFFGFIFSMPFTVSQGMQTDFLIFDSWAIVSLLFIVLCATFVVFLLNNWALQRVSPTVVGAYIYLQPLLASLIAVLFRNDPLTMSSVFAGICIFIGVYLTQKGEQTYKLKQ